jgi:hypothetical protein
MSTHVFSSPDATDLADLFSINQDLETVAGLLARLATVKNDTVTSSGLFVAALITYRRCFNTGVRVNLKRDDVVALPRNAIELHDYLVNLADKLAAHSVNAFEQTVVGIIVENDRVIGAHTFRQQLIGFVEAVQWSDLVALVQRCMVAPRLKAAQHAVVAAAKARPIEEIMKAPDPRLVTPGANDAGKRR